MNKYFYVTLLLTSLSSLSWLTVAIAKEQVTSNYNLELQGVKTVDLTLSQNRITEAAIAKTNVHQELNAIAKNSLITAVLEGKLEDNSAKNSSSDSVSEVTINLVKEFEGFRSSAYLDTDGTPIIGYGQSKIAGNQVQLGDRISHSAAHEALKAELEMIQQEILAVVTVELNDNQLGAITSLAFNTGVHAIKKSTLIKKLNQNDYLGAANEFVRWDKANIRGRLVIMEGLQKRRSQERQLFLTPENPTLTVAQQV